MTEKERNERILKSRETIRWSGEEFDSDQKLLRPQPPLTKAAVSDVIISLPRNFEDLNMKQDFVKIINDRRSNRVFTDGDMDLLTLSFLLWSTQGVKGIRGNNYATLRTVPSAGARHPMETYLYIRKVDGLKSGLYHYLPLEHSIELLSEIDINDAAFLDRVTHSVCGQKWVQKASVIFYYSLVLYRGEWRYGFNSHRVMMIDAGHVVENLYLSCSALGLGTCAIAALDTDTASGIFGLDGVEEEMFYCAPVGTISSENEDKEQGFYAFLKK